MDSVRGCSLRTHDCCRQVLDKLAVSSSLQAMSFATAIPVLLAKPKINMAAVKQECPSEKFATASYTATTDTFVFAQSPQRKTRDADSLRYKLQVVLQL